MRLTVRKATEVTMVNNRSPRDWKCPCISEVDAAKNHKNARDATPRNWTVSREKFLSSAPAGLAYFAATPAISTKYLGAARRASTVARAGGFAESIQASHTEFMSSK